MTSKIKDKELAMSIISRAKQQPLREKLSSREWHGLVGKSNKSGQAMISSRQAKQVKVFAEKQRRSIFNWKISSKKKIPKWIYTLTESKKSPEEIFKYIITRVKRAPSKSSLQLVQGYVNDVSKTEKGRGLIKEMIDQDLVDEFISLTNPKK